MEICIEFKAISRDFCRVRFLILLVNISLTYLFIHPSFFLKMELSIVSRDKAYSIAITANTFAYALLLLSNTLVNCCSPEPSSVQS